VTSELFINALAGTVVIISGIVSILSFHSKVYFHFKLLSLGSEKLRNYSFLEFYLFPFLFIKHFWILFPVYFDPSESKDRVRHDIEKKVLASQSVFWLSFLIFILSLLFLDMY
jgi:hypothetical protein